LVSSTDFLHALLDHKINMCDRAIALLWWRSRDDHNFAMHPKDIGTELRLAGYAEQNITRLRDGLARDKRTARAPGDCFRIRIATRAELDGQYTALAGHKRIKKSNSVLPSALFHDSKGYIEKVVAQLNASYEAGLFDCCAVMCRRLAETLLIEAYESRSEESKLQDSQGHFLMFSGLLGTVEKDNCIGLSRNAIRGLKDFKRLGDLSAHNRRYNARQSDIDRVRDGLRVASEELLKIAGLMH
jgi:hypothetical protein